MATELTDGLWHIDCATRDRPNVYLVDDGALSLVDAGWPGDVHTVRQGLDAAGVGPADIDRVLLTHYDADHVGTLARLTPELDAPVFIHEAEAPYVAGERLPPRTARHGLEALHRLYYRRLRLPDLEIRAIEGGESIGGFRALHTPGHTPGHVVYVHEGRSAAFLGDLAYALGDRLCASGWLSSYDTRQVEASIRSLRARTADVDHVCPGHGPPLEGLHTQLSRLLD
ncbi:MAG: MBL fold metallo-hydrolase [Halodesulfurarchaeum sp.]